MVQDTARKWIGRLENSPRKSAPTKVAIKAKAPRATNARFLLNGTTVAAGTNANSVQLSDVKLNGHEIPSGLLDWGLPGVGKSLRTYVIKYANKYGVTGGEITDGKVILRTGGR